MEIEQASNSIIFELPKQVKERENAVLDSYEINQSFEDNSYRFCIILSGRYLKNLLVKKQEPKFYKHESIKRQLPSDTILFQKIQFSQIRQKCTQQEVIQQKGNIQMSFISYKGLTVKLFLGDMIISPQDYIWAKCIYEGKEEEWKTKVFSMNKSENGKGYQFVIQDKQLEEYSKPNLAIQIRVQKTQFGETCFYGLRNQGNTCYMNSILQILFFIRPLRRTIVESKSSNKTIKVLQQLFVDLQNTREGIHKSVDAEQLISAYGRFSQHPRAQQDIHDFMLGFLEELENQNPSLKELWSGASNYILNSKQIDKPYRSVINDELCEIDIHMQDPKGNPLRNILESLKQHLQEQKVDDKIESDEFGKVMVGKFRQFLSLPNIMFFNVKRYQFRKQKGNIRKIMTNMEYPAEINLSFLMKTPTGQDLEYVLYAVTVHRGKTYNSGHYYSFINTSTKLTSPEWYKFNDSIVEKSSLEEALSFTGGKKTTINFDQTKKKFLQQSYDNEETAYLLCYIRNQKFQDYQQTITIIPKEYLQKKSNQMEMEKNTSAEVYVLKEKVDKDLDLFGVVETINIPLFTDEGVITQLKKIQNNYLGCKIGSIWKVNKMNKKIKKLVDFEDTPVKASQLFGLRKGHNNPDYLLIIPEDRYIHRGNLQKELSRKQKLGILRIVSLELSTDQPKQLYSYEVIVKKFLEEFISQYEQQKEKKGIIQQKQQFQYDWNDVCEIKFE